MREIRVRAWDAERGKMVYGDEIENDTQPYIEDGCHVCDTQRYFTGLSYGKLYVAYYNEHGDWTECEVMQSTGLEDRNGKEIYEGDVCNFPETNATPGVVTWYADGWRARTGHHVPWRMLLKHWKGCEVIRNIYENPSLLEAK